MISTLVVRYALFSLLILASLSTIGIFSANLPFISCYFFIRQEILALIVTVALFVLIKSSSPTIGALRSGRSARQPRLAQQGLLIALAVMTIGVSGGWLVFKFYPLSMDEFWARADGITFATGQPMARISPEWRQYAPALQPIFTRLLPEFGLWTSTYLPINSLIQHLFGVLASPLMAGLSIFLAADLARSLIPSERNAPLLCALLLASSSQLLVTEMTPYAMSGHLFFNLLWLWLFLRPGGVTKAGAMLVALLAMGLHQASYFPLFVLPFLFEAFAAGQRRLAAAHFLVVAAGFIAWSNYDIFAYWIMDAASPGNSTGGAPWLFGKFIEKVEGFSYASIVLMALNLLRFQLWQNLLVVPLVLLIAPRVIRTPGTLRALFVGMVLTTLFMLAVIPFQGHGWGYRYLHGLLGSASLLATYAYYRLKPDETQQKQVAQWRGFMAAMLAASLMILFPLHAWQAWRQAAPYVAANAALQQWDADVIVVDAPDHAYANDLVRNSPFLDNQPKRVAYTHLGVGQLATLCNRYEVRLFDDTSADRFGFPRWSLPDKRSKNYPENCKF
jgi:hypothetical protein